MKMTPVFTSVLATEMTGYLNLISETGRHAGSVKNSLNSLDQYLNGQNHADMTLPEEVVSLWIAAKQVKNITKANYISHIKGFVKYLVSLGFEASIPDLPIVRSDYVPYVFSEDELTRMASAGDNLVCGTSPARSFIVFPVLFRILYGCGLRLGEGLSLRWADVDLENGVITVLKGKNRKQRLVPMSHSLTGLLLLYKNKTRRENICGDYLFESGASPGKPFAKTSFHVWFSFLLEKANIHYTKQNRYERGPCPHCLRHTFVLHSFLKSEREGRKFEDTSAFLSAYLGHSTPRETDNYLKSSHLVYVDSHRRVNDYIGNLFPEVYFDEN
jgi:integrase